jgi:acyltransferase
METCLIGRPAAKCRPLFIFWAIRYIQKNLKEVTLLMQASAEEKRIWFIDIARFYAIALVFYGHFVEQIMLLQNPAASFHYKFVNSFHMVLFFILAGFVSREADLEFNFGKYLKYRFLSRLLPFIFFTIVFMIPPLFFSGWFPGIQLPTADGYIAGFISTVFGIPLFCVPTWFLLMLFSVEMVHYGAFRFLKSSNIKILIAVVVFYVVGYWVNLKLDIVNPAKGRLVGWNYLFIHEAITMYAFYLLGVYLRRKQFLMNKVLLKISIPIVIITLLIALFTFNLNNGPFNFNYYNTVIIIFAAHGSFIWFPITVIAASLFIFFLAKVTPDQKTMVWMGGNTLILMAMNGIFYHYINHRIARWFVDNLSGSGLEVLAVACVMTVASLALCIPLVYLFNKYVPQLVGKPKTNGPWLKNLI